MNASINTNCARINLVKQVLASGYKLKSLTERFFEERSYTRKESRQLSSTAKEIFEDVLLRGYSHNMSELIMSQVTGYDSKTIAKRYKTFQRQNVERFDSVPIVNIYRLLFGFDSSEENYMHTNENPLRDISSWNIQQSEEIIGNNSEREANIREIIDLNNCIGSTSHNEEIEQSNFCDFEFDFDNQNEVGSNEISDTSRAGNTISKQFSRLTSSEDHYSSFQSYYQKFEKLEFDKTFDSTVIPVVDRSSNEEDVEYLTLNQFSETFLQLRNEEKLRMLFHGILGNRKVGIDLSSYKYLQTNDITDALNIKTEIDIDSIIWCGERIPLESTFVSMSYFPFPNRSATLTRSTHFKVKGRTINQYPNVEIASMGDNNTIRIHLCFPGLIRKEGKYYVNFVETSTLKLLYDKYALKILKYLGQTYGFLNFTSNLPLSYQHESERCTRSGGLFRSEAYCIPKELVVKFLNSLVSLLNTDSDLRLHNAFFYIYSKGMKYKISQYQTFSEIFNSGNMRFYKYLIDSSPLDVHIDIALTRQSVADNGFLIFPCEGYFEKIKSTALLTNIEVDVISLLKELKGLHGRGKKKTYENLHICYFQVYSNIKNPLYFAKDSPFKFNFNEMLHNEGRFKKALSLMRTCYNLNSVNNYGWRTEMRVSSHLMQYLLEKEFSPIIPLAEGHFEIYVVPIQALNVFKISCMQIYNQVNLLIKVLQEAIMRTELRYRRKGLFRNESIFLLISWLIKGLVSRLEFSSWHKDVIEKLDLKSMFFTRGYPVVDEHLWRNLLIEIDSRGFEVTVPNYLLHSKRKIQTTLNESSFGDAECKIMSITTDNNKNVDELITLFVNIIRKEYIDFFLSKFPEKLTADDLFTESDPLQKKFYYDYNIPVRWIKSERTWSEYSNIFFNLDMRPLNEKGMQNWKNLVYLRILGTIKSNLSPYEFSIFSKKLHITFLSFECISALEPRGKYWTTKSYKGKYCVFMYIKH
jgi:hypothetical protein